MIICLQFYFRFSLILIPRLTPKMELICFSKAIWSISAQQIRFVFKKKKFKGLFQVQSIFPKNAVWKRTETCRKKGVLNLSMLKTKINKIFFDFIMKNLYVLFSNFQIL